MSPQADRPDETILVFPAGMPESIRYSASARARGLRIIGSSSLEFDPDRAAYESWTHLPYVDDEAFEPSLSAAIRRLGVTGIFTPHPVVKMLLQERLSALAPHVRLVEGATLNDHEAAYRALRQRLAAIPHDGPAAPRLVNAKPALRPMERDGLIRLIDTIPGMCSEEKILAVIDTMRCCPAGDIVEIGSWWGKSAALFVWLARRYEIGSVLCLDPWRTEALAQGNALLDRSSRNFDMDEALRIFELNLAPLAEGKLNYIRGPAHESAKLYKPGLVIETAAFGATRYAGAIALLHIDGNHAYEHAAQDERDWAKHVVPGGWIVFDDYVWAFGDGPKRVGDAFLSRNQARIAQAFTAGKALFVQLA
ncbi:MAG TPA: class I SAM-dependent methyltransferase [Caulobacterales bacterium]|jgi:hypothetical protein|nr:class I SAM-dependent methyltransferase [Caulobacterales bacterium]